MALVGTGRALLSGVAPWAMRGSALDIDFTHSQAAVNQKPVSLTGLLTTARASTGYGQTLAGTLTNFLANTSRITTLGDTVEPAATNTLLWSQTFQNAVWSKLDGGTITDNAAVAPDLTTTAASFVGVTRVRQLTGGVTVPSTWTYSVWIKGITATSVTIRLTNNFDSEGADAICTVTPGAWTFCQVTFTYTATSSGRNYDARFKANNGSFYAWGAQLETGAAASTYVPTTIVAATRAADAAVVALPNVSRIVFTFSDATTQTISGLTPYSNYSIPTNLNKPVIARLTGYPT